MSEEVQQISKTPLSIGCYRRRVAFVGENIYYTHENKVFCGDAVYYESQNQIFEIIAHNDGIVTIDCRGNVVFKNHEKQETNILNGYAGIFSAIVMTKSLLIAVHDLSHTIRIIDPNTFATIHTINTPGIPNTLASLSDDTFVITDDRTMSIIDGRTYKIQRSSVLSAQPVSIFAHGETVFIACDDRRLRLYDIRRLKTPLKTTKPASKNGTAAMWTLNGKEVAAVGFDEGMTLVEPDKDVGQFKRCKYLAESPFVSAPVEIDGGFAVLTRSGNLIKLKDPIAFLRSQSANPAEDEE